MTTGRINQVATDQTMRRVADGCNVVAGPVHERPKLARWASFDQHCRTATIVVGLGILPTRASSDAGHPSAFCRSRSRHPVSGREQQDGQERNRFTQRTEYCSQRATPSWFAVGHCVIACATSARPHTSDANATYTGRRSTDTPGTHPRVHGHRASDALVDFPGTLLQQHDSCAYISQLGRLAMDTDFQLVRGLSERSRGHQTFTNDCRPRRLLPESMHREETNASQQPACFMCNCIATGCMQVPNACMLSNLH